MHPEAGSQGANALWHGQPHHLEGMAAPPHTCKASQWRRVSPLHLGNSLSPVSRLLDWERGCFRGLVHWNLASALVSTRLAQVWPSPNPPVSIGAGVSEREGPATGVFCIGDSLAGVSCGGVAVIPILGPLGPTTGPLACLYDSSLDSLGFSCGHLGNGAPIKWGHSWTWPHSTNSSWN